MAKTELSVFGEIHQVSEDDAGAEGLADMEADWVVPHEDLVDWLKGWCTPEE